jgi:hypothetical protein
LKDGQQLGPWPLNAEADWWEGEKAQHVRMGTVHAFKGLEADVVIYLAPAYAHSDGQRLAYTAYSRARHRLVVLEKAIAHPARPVAMESSTRKAPDQQGRFNVANNLTEGNREALMGALTAVGNWRPKVRAGL